MILRHLLGIIKCFWLGDPSARSTHGPRQWFKLCERIIHLFAECFFAVGPTIIKTNGKSPRASAEAILSNGVNNTFPLMATACHLPPPPPDSDQAFGDDHHHRKVSLPQLPPWGGRGGGNRGRGGSCLINLSSSSPAVAPPPFPCIGQRHRRRRRRRRRS